MNQTNHQTVYAPDEWDIDFSFDLDLSLIDYLLVAGYLLIVVPAVLLIKTVEAVYAWFAGLFGREQVKSEPKQAQYGLASTISKMF